MWTYSLHTSKLQIYTTTDGLVLSHSPCTYLSFNWIRLKYWDIWMRVATHGSRIYIYIYIGQHYLVPGFQIGIWSPASNLHRGERAPEPFESRRTPGFPPLVVFLSLQFPFSFSFSRPGVVGVATVSVFFLFSDLGRGGRGWLPFTTGSKGLQTCLIWYLYLLVERNF